MNTHTFGVGIAALIIGVLIGYTIAPGDAPYGRSQMLGRGMMTTSIDQHFIEQMIPHHEGAIAMAEVALRRSTRTEVRSLANDIIAAQTREIDNMRAWYEDWFDASVPVTSQTMMGGHSMVHMDSMSGDIAALETVSDFDRAFVTQMIPHHEMAIMMARMLAATTERQEMKTLADDISTSQAQEIEMMRNWLATW